MPKKPMKNRMIRVPDELWEAALTRADERGESLSEAIRTLLRRYVR
jgi:predicted HicB family RNase H-like nuclease